MTPWENAGDRRHFSFVRSSRSALLVLLGSTLVVVGCTTWIEQRVAPAGEESVSVPLPVGPLPPTPKAEVAATPALRMPVEGIAFDELHDSFSEGRGKRRHQALDIMAARGTPVVAAVAGEVAKVYRHALGGLSVYQYDADRRFAFYYAHLDSFAPGLAAGKRLAAGELIGRVGATGNATSPHLHFAIYRLGPDRQWWRGTAVNPYERLAAGLTQPPRASP